MGFKRYSKYLARASFLVEGTRLSVSYRPVRCPSDDAMIEPARPFSESQQISQPQHRRGGGDSDQRARRSGISGRRSLGSLVDER